jgi:Flp pilus assembly protein TadG
MFRSKSGGGGLYRLFRHSEGGGIVSCAVAAPLLVLAFAVATDYTNVSRFRTHVKLAADAASVAAAEVTARQPDGAGELASQVGAAVFVRDAPRGAAGTPTVGVKNRAAMVTATVGYAGVAPSNFGSALGYDRVKVDASATSFAPIADSRPASAR